MRSEHHDHWKLGLGRLRVSYGPLSTEGAALASEYTDAAETPGHENGGARAVPEHTPADCPQCANDSAGSPAEGASTTLAQRNRPADHPGNLPEDVSDA
jgi:hypothetical protein